MWIYFVCQVDELREAIEELFYFEFVLDDIPIWGFVGYIEESGFLPHSHKVKYFVLLSVCRLCGAESLFKFVRGFIFVQSSCFS